MAVLSPATSVTPHYPRSKPLRFCARTEFKNFTSTATITVGPSPGARFLIHRELLTAQSPFFTAALNGTFEERFTQSIHFPDIAIPIFEIFVHWLYSNTLPSTLFYKDGKPMYYTALQLYALADRLQVEALRNDCVDLVAELADETNSVLTPSDTWILCESCPATCSMHRLVVDLFAFKKTDRLLETHPDEWHPLFLRDLVIGLKRPRERALNRHADLKLRNTKRWAEGKVCETCRKVLAPGFEVWCCGSCEKSWCRRCKEEGKEWVRWEGGKEACIPWRREKRCEAYHEHRETIACCEGGV